VNCTHAMIGHLSPGQQCPWRCGTAVTAEQIAAANASPVGESQAAPSGVSPTVRTVGAPPGEPSHPGRRVDPPPALFAPDVPPRARRTDPATAHDAARHATPGATLDSWLVLAAHLAAERGLTGDELAAATGRKYESVGPRRKPLTDIGWLAATEMRRDRKGVWVGTADGHYAWATAPVDVRRTVLAALDAAKQAAA
jgi:hypothetical protein